MDELNKKWLKGEKNWYFRRKQEVVESLIIGSCLNVGCGEHKIKGAKNVDYPKFDATKGKCWNKKYDTVILSDVLEHINPQSNMPFIALSNAITSANKRVIITVPAYMWLYSKYDRLLGHYCRYESKYFKVVSRLSEHKFSISHLFGLLLPLFWLRKIMNKGETPRLPKWLDWIFYQLSKITLPWGSTLLVVIDK